MQQAKKQDELKTALRTAGRGHEGLILGVAMILVAGCGAGDNGQSGGRVNGNLSVSGTALSIVDFQPADGSKAIERDAKIRIQFNQDLDTDSIDSNAFILKGPQGKVAGDLKYDEDSKELVFTAEQPLGLLYPYEAKITKKLKTRRGGELQDEFAWTFTTREGRWGPMIGVHTPGRQTKDLRLSVDQRGDATALWAEKNQEGFCEQPVSGEELEKYFIYAKRFDAENETWDGDTSLLRSCGVREFNSDRPLVEEMNADGDVVTIRRQRYVDGGDPNRNLVDYKARIFDVAAQSWGEDMDVELWDTDTKYGYPKIATRSNGDTIFAFEQKEFDDDLITQLPTARVFVNHLDADTGTLRGVNLLNQPGELLLNTPALDQAENGDAIIMWASNVGQASADNELYVHHYDPISQAWLPTKTLHDFGDDYDLRQVQVELDNMGNAVAIYLRVNNDNQNEKLFAQSFDVATKTWTESVLISSDTSPITLPVLNLNGGGEALVTFQQGGFMHAIKYLPGSGWQNSSTLNSGAGTSLASSISAIDEAGNAMAAWVELDANLDVEDLFVARYIEGKGWSAPEQMDTFADLSVKRARVNIGKNGDAIVLAFVENTPGSHPINNIFALHFN